MRASSREVEEPTLRADPTHSMGGATNRQVEELWFALARTEWTSLAIVPVEVGQRAADVAKALAEVGNRVGELPVKAFAFTMDSSAPENSIPFADAAKLASSTALKRQGGMPSVSPPGQVIFTVAPIIREPLGMAVLQAVDVVLLCIEMGRTRLDAARRTLELVGRERVGCLVMHTGRRFGGPR
jgi:hypothetical protein